MPSIRAQRATTQDERDRARRKAQRVWHKRFVVFGIHRVDTTNADGKPVKVRRILLLARMERRYSQTQRRWLYRHR